MKEFHLPSPFDVKQGELKSPKKKIEKKSDVETKAKRNVGGLDNSRELKMKEEIEFSLFTSAVAAEKGKTRRAKEKESKR